LTKKGTLGYSSFTKPNIDCVKRKQAYMLINRNRGNNVIYRSW